jgi:hypothetical protein
MTFFHLTRAHGSVASYGGLGSLANAPVWRYGTQTLSIFYGLKLVFCWKGLHGPYSGLSKGDFGGLVGCLG